jgi:transcriptional regulator with XRE-family HTH domain
MPRPNPPRSIASEKALARRIAFERERLEMSYDGLASRMEQVGCPINASGIYKIEKSGRRITVDELVGFSLVFGVAPQELLLPPELAAREELKRLVLAWDSARADALDARDRETESWSALRDWIAAHPEAEEDVERAMRLWAEWYFEDDDQREAAFLHWMVKAAPTPSRKKAYAAHMEKVLD